MVYTKWWDSSALEEIQVVSSHSVISKVRLSANCMDQAFRRVAEGCTPFFMLGSVAQSRSRETEHVQELVLDRVDAGINLAERGWEPSFRMDYEIPCFVSSTFSSTLSSSSHSSPSQEGLDVLSLSSVMYKSPPKIIALSATIQHEEDPQSHRSSGDHRLPLLRLSVRLLPFEFSLKRIAAIPLDAPSAAASFSPNLLCFGFLASDSAARKLSCLSVSSPQRATAAALCGVWISGTASTTHPSVLGWMSFFSLSTRLANRTNGPWILVLAQSAVSHMCFEFSYRPLNSGLPVAHEVLLRPNESSYDLCPQSPNEGLHTDSEQSNRNEPQQARLPCSLEIPNASFFLARIKELEEIVRHQRLEIEQLKMQQCQTRPPNPEVASAAVVPGSPIVTSAVGHVAKCSEDAVPNIRHTANAARRRTPSPILSDVSSDVPDEMYASQSDDDTSIADSHSVLLPSIRSGGVSGSSASASLVIPKMVDDCPVDNLDALLEPDTIDLKYMGIRSR
eukprot:ANDGO_04811.mRNA.1 hypothetical protein